MSKTLILPLLASLSLTACMDIEGGGEAVMRNIVDDGLSCPGSPHMVTAYNLPVRCGPQRISPYTLR